MTDIKMYQRGGGGGESNERNGDGKPPTFPYPTHEQENLYTSSPDQQFYAAVKKKRGSSLSAIPQTDEMPGSPPPAHSPIIVRPETNPGGLLGGLQTAGGVIFLGLMGYSFHLVLAVALYIIIGLALGHRTFPLILLTAWVGQALIPIARFRQDPVALKISWLFRELSRYFEQTLIMEQRLDTSRLYMLAQFPHGTIPLPAILAAHYVYDVVPGKKIFCLIHTGMLHLPIVRFFLGRWGAVPASKECIHDSRHRYNSNCTILVGGVQEMFLQDDKQERIKMRRGFVREAVRNGYDLVPMYQYGSTRLYRFLPGPASFWGKLSSKLPFPIFMVTGWKGTLLPVPTPIVTAVGSPIGVANLIGIKDGQPVAEPTPEQIEIVKEKFQAELVKMYYRYRPDWETRELVVVE